MALASAGVTTLLQAWDAGDLDARDRVMRLLYSEMRGLANRVRARQSPSATLTPTALVHEVNLKLLEQRRVPCRNRVHFLAFSATIMRNLLVDRARAKLRHKRGSGQRPNSLEAIEEGVTSADPDPSVLALDDALAALETVAPRGSKVVELRFFAGMSHEEVAAHLGVSVRTVERDWQAARMWLRDSLKGAQ